MSPRSSFMFLSYYCLKLLTIMSCEKHSDVDLRIVALGLLGMFSLQGKIQFTKQKEKSFEKRSTKSLVVIMLSNS